MSRPKSRLRLVVFDGLDWEWCSAHRDLCDALWDVAADGCSAPLRACDVPVTPTAVGALLAGREVDLGWSGDHYTSSQELIRTRPWIHDLARQGLTVGLVNVPLTWPAFPLPRGSWVVSGFPVDPIAKVDARRPWFSPRGLDVLGYPIDAVVCDHGPGGTKDVAGLSRAEAEIERWLRDSAPPADVEVVWFRSTDGAGHHLWGTDAYRLAVRDALSLLPRLRDGTENLIVVSDHGFDALRSPRCSTYLATNHGPPSIAAGLVGGHAMEGVLVAAGDDVHARGELPEQRLVEIAGGLYDLLRLPPPVGLISKGPAWAQPVAGEGDELVRRRLRELGYLG